VSARGFEEAAARLEEAARRASPDGASEALRMALNQMMDAAPIPEDTGRLRASLTQPGHPEQVFEVNGERFRFGTRVPYAAHAMHQLPPLQAAELERALQRYIEESFP
jgi:hypothetical protein